MGKQRRTQEQMETLRSAIYAVAQADRPVSIRHIFYRMVTQNLVEKSNKGYQQLQKATVDMRDTKALPYSWIEDSSRHAYPDSPPDMVGSCLVCFQGVSGCRPGVTHDMIGHRTGSRVPSLRVSAAVRCQLWLFSGQRRHGRAWQLGRVAYKPMLQAGSPMLDAARQPAPISSAAP